MSEQAKPKIKPDLIRRIAQTLTNHQGSEALNRLAKQLVVGSARLKGFVDHQNDNMQEVYDTPWVRLGYFNVLTRFSFANAAGTYTWDFASGVTEGQKLDGFASTKGRISHWVGAGAKKEWEEHKITGVVLVGMYDVDVEFFYIERDEFLEMNADRIAFRRRDSEELQRWSKAWNDLVLQPTFSSLLG